MVGRSKIVADLLDAVGAGSELLERGRDAYDNDRVLRLAVIYLVSGSNFLAVDLVASSSTPSRLSIRGDAHQDRHRTQDQAGPLHYRRDPTVRRRRPPDLVAGHGCDAT